MGAKLVAYSNIPLGFENVITQKEDFPEEKAWNLWFNVKLSDDPETWDEEIKLINEMQDKLRPLTVGHRLIRAQIAEFCRRHPLFPQSIEILCKEIGDSLFSNPVKIGCLGRNLLDSLGLHGAESLTGQRKEVFKEYSHSLKKWLELGQPDNSTDVKVFRFLGKLNDTKEIFAKRLLSVIDSGKVSVSDIKKLCAEKHRETQGKSVYKADWTPFPFECFVCKDGCPEGIDVPICQCCDSMIIEAGLLCTGPFGEKKQMANEFRRFIEEYIVAYANAINSWLVGEPPKKITPLDVDITTIYRKIKSHLGVKDPTKEWLAACLLKTIKDNQKEYPEDGVSRPELIDDFPETTSWFER
jgi:hypothetical protein